MEHHIKRSLAIVIGVIVIAALGLILLFANLLLKHKNSESNPKTVSANWPAFWKSAKTPDYQSRKVFIYTKEISSTDADNRNWPVVEIRRKVDGQPAETLATVGKVGEYPFKFILSSDKKFLFVNLGSKLQILNLTTKELRDLATAKEEFLSLAFSPDRKQLFLWDQKYAENTSRSYYAHLLSLANDSDQIIAQGVNEEPVYGNAAWRSDNVVVLEMAQGDGSWEGFFNINKKELTQSNTDKDLGLSQISSDGLFMETTVGTTPDPCGGMVDSSPSVVNFVDPVTRTVKATVGALGRLTWVIAFSPASDQVLFSTADVAKTAEVRCEDWNPAKSYFIKSLTNKDEAPKAIASPLELKNWPLEGLYDSMNGWKIKFGGQEVLSDDGKMIGLIAVYN